MNVSLIMHKADGRHREFPLQKARTVIGRRDTCDLRVPLGSVSRQHCEIIMESGGSIELKLRDLGSSNGTFHNQHRVREARLAPGDRVAIGPVVFIVSVDGEPSIDSLSLDERGAAVGGDLADSAFGSDESSSPGGDSRFDLDLDIEPDPSPQEDVPAAGSHIVTKPVDKVMGSGSSRHAASGAKQKPVNGTGSGGGERKSGQAPGSAPDLSRDEDPLRHIQRLAEQESRR